MDRLRRLRRPERIVLIIALGVAVQAFCSYFVPLNTLPFASTSQFTFLQAGPPGWIRVLVWFVLIALWAGCSIGLLRLPPPE